MRDASGAVDFVFRDPIFSRLILPYTALFPNLDQFYRTPSGSRCSSPKQIKESSPLPHFKAENLLRPPPGAVVHLSNGSPDINSLAVCQTAATTANLSLQRSMSPGRL